MKPRAAQMLTQVQIHTAQLVSTLFAQVQPSSSDRWGLGAKPHSPLSQVGQYEVFCSFQNPFTGL